MGRGTAAMLAATLTAMMVSSCGQSADEKPDSSGAATSAPAPGDGEAGDRETDGAADGERAAEALEEAIAELVRLDTGHYRHVITFRDSVSSASVESPENNPVATVGIRFTGGYWISAGSASVTGIAFSEEREQVQLRQRIVRGRVYVQSPGWPRQVRRCWVGLAGDGVDQFTSQITDAGEPMSLRMPMALVGLDQARGVEILGDEVSATIPLATALAAVAPGLLGKVDRADLDGRNPATFRLRDGRVTGWQVWGRDVLDVLDESGFPIRGPFRKLGHTSAEVTFSRVGQTVAPQSPPRRLRLSQAAFDRGETCDG